MELVARLMIKILPLITIVITAIGGSCARELRPSDHGLDCYQSGSPPAVFKSPEMMSFFGSSSSPSDSALPKATRSSSSNGTWQYGRGGGRGGGGDHMIRHVLLVASLVCGVTGVVLLVASALIYFLRSQNENSSSCSDTKQ